MPIRVMLAFTDAECARTPEAFIARLHERLGQARNEVLRKYARLSTPNGGKEGGQPERLQSIERSEPALKHHSSGARLVRRSC
jgi:hypothetical protein